MSIRAVCTAVGLASVAASYSASQDASRYAEPENFDVTQALSEYGVNLLEMPGLATTREQSSNLACNIACNSLKDLYGDDSTDVQGSASYLNYTASYWSQLQAEVSSTCIFYPASITQVSVLVLLSRLTQCPFAVRSGGHAAFSGASAMAGGITVSFRNLNAISISEDKTTASIQPGNTWYTIYSTLAPYDISVIGGRVSDIGVGGLTTGGGISFFSNIYGWACDNVASYDVVTATGKVITATPDEFPDLYWALRGGGNNFGLVVGFKLSTIPLAKNEMWGGSKVFTEESFPAVVEAFTDLVVESPKDPNAGTWIAWVMYSGVKLCSSELWYAKPNGGNATIFRNFNGITAVSDTTTNRTLAGYTFEVNESNPDGYREVYYATSIKASLETATAAVGIFWEEMEAAGIPEIEGALASMIWQGITDGVLNAMTRNGGNPLGLSPGNGPYYLISVCASWADPENDAVIYQTLSNILTRIKTEATARGVQNDYVYMNYASQYQDVISSYGPSNKAKLKNIASKYDPAQVFQILQPGYFKLDRAPVPNCTYFSF